MDVNRRQPIGIELVKRGVVSQAEIKTALDYQKQHPDAKLGDIIHDLKLCDERKLLAAIGEIFGEKTMLIHPHDIKVQIDEFISPDTLKQNSAVLFDVEDGKAKVCFADTANRKAIDTIRLLLLNRGLVMDKYITFKSNITEVLNSMAIRAAENFGNGIGSDATTIVDSIIKNGMEKRASDIHFEPMENKLRVRFRIDGELFEIAEISKDKQTQVIGRLKAISNMHQEKQEAQDGRITMYPDYNIRVSSQKNIYGEKFVLRLLKRNANVREIFELGFPRNEELVKNSFDKKNSVTIMAAPTGEGKTTTLYSIVQYLNSPEINITTIEDPVEIRIPGLNQVEVDAKTSFIDSLRTVLRQDPDIILVGEIRDKETAEIAMQAGQTGHYVLSTIHTIDAIEVITRLRKMGVSNYDISSTVATTVSQRLVRRLCKHCAREREFTQKELDFIHSVEEKSNVKFNLEGKRTYDAVGCKECNNIGYMERIGIFEVLVLDDALRELITNDASTFQIKEQAMKGSYRPLIVDGVSKVLSGETNLDELDRKMRIY
ncbi:MAG: type II/IV secretion system protein [Clostridia bacterium]|nr:type II/IV secretion system protein [Clostridia bacterium]